MIGQCSLLWSVTFLFRNHVSFLILISGLDASHNLHYICYLGGSLWDWETHSNLECIPNHDGCQDGLDDTTFQYNECMFRQDLDRSSTAANFEQKSDLQECLVVFHSQPILCQSALCHRHLRTMYSGHGPVGSHQGQMLGPYYPAGLWLFPSL